MMTALVLCMEATSSTISLEATPWGIVLISLEATSSTTHYQQGGRQRRA